MFQATQSQSLAASAVTFFNLTFHNAVQSVRSSHRNAVLSIVFNIFQTVIMVGAFFLLFDILGLRGAAVRGDFLLYVMSGIFVYMTHIKALGAVAGAPGTASPELQHLPMTQPIAVCSAALGSLYTQFISMGAILLFYHLLWRPIEIYQPFNAAMILVLAWFSGCCFGLCFLALKPWLPKGSGMLRQVYVRVNMFASGKMFLANLMPAYMIAMFDWNPLFHIIDQGRGFVFINYNPMKSDLLYPIWVPLIFAAIGIVGISFTAKRESLSWSAGR